MCYVSVLMNFPVRDSCYILLKFLPRLGLFSCFPTWQRRVDLQASWGYIMKLWRREREEKEGEGREGRDRNKRQPQWTG